ncbi:Imm7 family immunity protein [Rubinisphaera sp. JC750]|uniref:Imm7 family immunity protein n=1 Tax=Rubinisphaera sp. JC750 TaxID=2898658 RepID=UPI001F22F24B|nr:Imm7 family immunity protein [Rubinisphaera sp. JC750]
MFEFHGWARIHYHTHDTNSIKQNHCWDQLAEYVSSIPHELIHLHRCNGCDSLVVAGMHNHRANYIIDLFQWVARNATGSYGILYIRDDEDVRNDANFTNCFRVWRLCRGKLTEHNDPFLSPAIPIVEDPYEESRGD